MVADERKHTHTLATGPAMGLVTHLRKAHAAAERIGLTWDSIYDAVSDEGSTLQDIAQTCKVNLAIRGERTALMIGLSCQMRLIGVHCDQRGQRVYRRRTLT